MTALMERNTLTPSHALLRIGVDLDGVCYDFDGSLAQFLTEHRNMDRSLLPPSTRWEFYLDWGLSLDEFLDACHEGVKADVVFTYGNAFPGTRSALERITARGHTLHVVTDRNFGGPGVSEAATARWVANELPKIKSLTFSADKTVANVDMMIDDKLQNYDALEAVGVDVYLFDRPWNQVPGDDHRKRVRSMHEFADRVLAKAAALV